MDSVDITHIVPALFDKDRGTIGGAERYVLELAKAMATKRKVRLISFADETSVWKEGDLEVCLLKRRYAVRGQHFNPLSPEIFGYLSKTEILHFHQKHILNTSLAAFLAKFLFSKKNFVTDLGGGGWDISAYVSTNNLFRNELHISEYSRNLQNRNDTFHKVIWGGVDQEKFKPSRDTDRNGFLFVGRVLPHKGIDFIVDNLPEGAELKIAGPLADEDYVTYLKERSRGKKVQFLGIVEERNLLELYQSSTALLLPSVYKDYLGRESRVPELLGQSVLEAMASGTAVVVTDVASLPELVTDGKEGFVVSPKSPESMRNALTALMNDGEKAIAFGQAGRRRVEEFFTWAATVERCLQYYYL